jgi:hypothetical protein
MSFVDNCERNAEAQALQIADFLVQGDDFREEVDLQLEDITAACSRSVENN